VATQARWLLAAFLAHLELVVFLAFQVSPALLLAVCQQPLVACLQLPQLLRACLVFRAPLLVFLASDLGLLT
jgi:hypothetical protein